MLTLIIGTKPLPRAIGTAILSRMSEPSAGPRPKQHLYSLDILRGLGALIIVIFHWGAFFSQEPYTMERLPGFRWLKPFYVNGWEAVNLFFCLSGFVFFWLYADVIRERRLAAAKFALWRFSRLYPLHVVTLILVAVGQVAFHAHFGRDFGIYNNDLRHFFLQLFMASNWGFASGASFNGPSWSVSVEILLYTLFFLICFLRFDKTAGLVGFVLLGYLIQMLPAQGAREIGSGLFCFFIGGLAFRLFRLLRALELSRSFLLAATVLMAGLWLLLPWDYRRQFLYHQYSASFLPAMLTWHGHDAGAFALLTFTGNSINLILYPLTLVLLALLETRGFISGRRFAFVGDLSYSSYLLHFPLQMVFYAVVQLVGGAESWFYTATSFLVFFSVLIPLSLASHYYFERPVQTLLRQKLPGANASG